ncbi:hypothetical protein M404DRAFT_1006676 [Pisolithus tinctorius Marx 270]|uniref:Uncharacterized protein n=1 Tax=Pisolithus tinctorius Marx 270 TaxID=870435 RepID=A0A0C3IHZ5_PISTI|nr:hypothetical protein M404DRAFT_1006676 [Pisolithus tinctorius Marx 270]
MEYRHMRPYTSLQSCTSADIRLLSKPYGILGKLYRNASSVTTVVKYAVMGLPCV